MSFKEVKKLRHSGKLNEALKMALQDLESDPENILNKRSISWVYYSFLKKYASLNSYDDFKETLQKIKELNLPENEKMLFDSCAWQTGKLVLKITRQKNFDFNKIDKLFNSIKEFHFTKPSEAYSYLFKAFHKGFKNNINYLGFADWWNFDNFRPEDYLQEEFKGKKIMSIVEQAYIVYSKKLIEIENIKSGSNNLEVLINAENNRERINDFMPKLETLIKKHPEYQYPPYYKAKILLALGKKDNILSAFLPFARKKHNTFWIWDLMAEIFKSDKEMQFSCYSKALSLNTQEEYLVKLRKKYAILLIEKKLYNEAKTEIQKIINTRKKNNWNISHYIIKWTKQDWYNEATPYNDNKELYLKNLDKAEEIFFKDVPEEIIAVNFINENRKIISFVINENKHGFFKYYNKVNNPKIGNLYKVRLKKINNEGFYKLLSIKKVEGETSSPAIKEVEGKIRVNERGFGFVEDVFLSGKFIRKNKLTNNTTLRVKAVLSFNKKKDKWGWTAFELL